MVQSDYTLDFSEIGMQHLAQVGGKNASLGEMFNHLKPLGVNVLDGFAVTAHAYRTLLEKTGASDRLQALIAELDVNNLADLAERAHSAREAILEVPLLPDITEAILAAYDRLRSRLGRDAEVAVRSSATVEDLPGASYAGQQETFLNVRGKDALLRAVQACFASCFTDRAISYRAEHGFDHLKAGVSVGVQPMVRSDRGSAGVIFTLDPESGFRDVTVVTSSYGLGEFVVQGVVNPDEWMVFKPTLASGNDPIISRSLGSKEVRLVYAGGSRSTKSEATPADERARFSLRDDEVLTLARWAGLIEEHYSRLAGYPQPMDIEWAKDGVLNDLFILQARPETVHSTKSRTVAAQVFHLKGTPGKPLVTGTAVGEKIGTGRVRVVRDTTELSAVRAGEVLIAEMTNPDWEPVMKRVAAVVTDKGGRTAHAAIVSRELGLPCIVGTDHATEVLQTGQEVTVSCAEGPEGRVYSGIQPFEVRNLDAAGLPSTRTSVMLNVGDPSRVFQFSAIPNDGVGLARIEFIINNHIGIHPMALVRYPELRDREAVIQIQARLAGDNPKEFFVRRLSEGVARIAAAFYPKPVIVRASDFKTNEYAKLLGGAEFEPQEENPMLGFRGASRYYDARYAEGFGLECAALARVRRQMGLKNVRVMIPFCRTVEEAKRVIAVMADQGLRQGEDGLEVYGMCEIPSNVVLASEFLSVFDGYSIGSNDLTQLILGLDRDSGTVAHLFDERNDAVRRMIAQAIDAARRANKPIGICGQAPSDYPEFAEWLVECGIHSVSLNPDTAIQTRIRIAAKEREIAGRTAA